ncbi:AAA family ATPase [Streptomyces sp. I8-5]|uniref:AAA family ATPase n=1 Tax=Streptomyces sp. I8-5 TaxID=3104277 RepID=UPI00386CDB4D
MAISDVLDTWVGNSEHNTHGAFETARRKAPCVVFLDELDALGAKRSRTQRNGRCNTVIQLLIAGRNRGRQRRSRDDRTSPPPDRRSSGRPPPRNGTSSWGTSRDPP